MQGLKQCNPGTWVWVHRRHEPPYYAPLRLPLRREMASYPDPSQGAWAA